MVNRPSVWQRFTSIFRTSEPYETPEVIRPLSIHVDPIGSSGTEIYSGYIYEDYLQEIRGPDAADIFDKIRRSDANIKMLLSAVKNPIKSAKWYIDAASDAEEHVNISEHVQHILFDGMDKAWTEILHEILSFVDYGYSVFEITHKAVIDSPQFGSYNGIKSLGFRSQRTIQRWNVDPMTGGLKSIDQQAYGDLQRILSIPAEYLMVFSLDKEGDNYEGISWLRSCYGAWKRKQSFLKLLAAGMEKYAIPPPVLKIPDDKQGSTQFSQAIDVLKKYLSHQQQYITIPTGWDIDFLKTNFDPETIKTSIEAENIEMIRAFLANFLLLGSTGTGSYALSFDQSDFFLGGIEQIANLICEKFNRGLIPHLVKVNYGPQENYPKLKFSGISDRAGKEFAEVIKMLIEAQVLVADDDLEDNLRERFNLPTKSQVGQRQYQKPQASQQAIPIQTSEKQSSIKLADPKKQIKDSSQDLTDYMQLNLKLISENMIKQIMAGYRNLPDGKRFDAIKGVQSTGQQEYQKGLLELLGMVGFDAYESAKKELPKDLAKKLHEVPHGTMKLSEFDNLPADVRKRIQTLAQILVGTQIDDLSKKLNFAYMSSVDSTESAAVLEKDLKDAAAGMVLGPSIDKGSVAVASQVVNEVRKAVFFDDKVFEQVESYTFVNGDPVSDICAALAGTVFAKDDPDLQTYWPPLHWNCKSYLVPNLVGNDNKDITEKDDDWNEAVGAAQNSINLAECQSGFVMQSVKVSKKLATSLSDAQRYAKEYGAEVETYTETEDTYFFTQKDPGLFVEGTLKSFEPIEGVWILFGMIKMPELSEIKNPRQGNLQTVIVSKGQAKTIEEAKKVAKDMGAEHLDVDETEESFRFRQRNPTDFKEGSFRTKRIPQKGVSLVYGQLK